MASQTATGVVGATTSAIGATTDAAADATRTAAEAASDQPPIDEVARRLQGISGEELRRTRANEQRNKNRATLIEQIDRRLEATT